jgi:hypothetical protein
MRLVPTCIILSGMLLSTAACDRPADTTDDRRTRQEKADQAAHQAGEEAYKAAEKAKEATREAAEDLKKAGREVREGWEDAKRKNPDPDAPHPKQ